MNLWSVLIFLRSETQGSASLPTPKYLIQFLQQKKSFLSVIFILWNFRLFVWTRTFKTKYMSRTVATIEDSENGVVNGEKVLTQLTWKVQLVQLIFFEELTTPEMQLSNHSSAVLIRHSRSVKLWISPRVDAEEFGKMVGIFLITSHLCVYPLERKQQTFRMINLPALSLWTAPVPCKNWKLDRHTVATGGGVRVGGHLNLWPQYF